MRKAFLLAFLAVIYIYKTNEILKLFFTGVMHANINNGAEERPSSHRQPKVGATASASATSKHAPSAQKH